MKSAAADETDLISFYAKHKISLQNDSFVISFCRKAGFHYYYYYYLLFLAKRYCLVVYFCGARCLNEKNHFSKHDFIGTLFGSCLSSPLFNGTNPRNRCHALPPSYSRTSLRLCLRTCVGCRRRLYRTASSQSYSRYASPFSDSRLYGV